MCCSVGCTSCSNDTPWGVEYSLTSNGKTDGSLSVAFVNGDFSVVGDAGYEFSWSNAPEPDSVTVLSARRLEDVFRSSDLVTLEAAEYVDTWLYDQIKVTSFEGHYDFYVKGYVKETKTQITFSIDRHFSN